MRLFRSFAVVGIGTAAFWFIAAGLAHPASSAEAREIVRIRAHFDSVLSEVASRDLGTLTAAQRDRRRALTSELRAYRDRGVFPHNYDFPGRAVPYFVDRKTGTLCAVANLLAATGRRDIVDRVANMDNNVWVSELAGDTAFTSWLDANGITLAEAARIQVPYSRPVSTGEIARQMSFLVVAPVAVAGALVTAPWNAFGNGDGRHTRVSAIGMTAGLLAGTAGGLLLSVPELSAGVQEIGVATIGVGALSMAASAHAMFRHHSTVVAKREAEQRARIASASVAPLVVEQGGKAGLGAMVALRF